MLTILSLLDELDDREDDDFTEFDADKEQTKEEIKKLCKKGITDLLDELWGDIMNEEESKTIIYRTDARFW